MDKILLAKTPSSKTTELDKIVPEYKQWSIYWRQNAKAGSVILAAQESEDLILALREANKLTLTWPSGTASDLWQTLIDIFQPDDELSEM